MISVFLTRKKFTLTNNPLQKNDCNMSRRKYERPATEVVNLDTLQSMLTASNPESERYRGGWNSDEKYFTPGDVFLENGGDRDASGDWTIDAKKNWENDNLW